jgi:hypothetical protein
VSTAMLCVTEPPSPVPRLLLRGRNGDDIDISPSLCQYTSENLNLRSITRRVFWPYFGQASGSGSRLHFCGMNRFVIEFREPSADSRVVLDFVQKFGTSFRVIADRPHRRIRRRASA